MSECTGPFFSGQTSDLGPGFTGLVELTKTLHEKELAAQIIHRKLC